MTVLELKAKLWEACELSNWHFEQEDFVAAEFWHLQAVEWQSALDLATRESA